MVTQFIERYIKGTPLWQEAEQAAKAGLQEHREQLVAELEHIRTRLLEGAPARTKRIQDAQAEVAKAIEALTLAQREQSRVHGEVRSEVIRAEQAIGQKELELRQTCPEAVRNFIDSVGAQHDFFRSSSSNWPYKTSEYRQNDELRPGSFPDQEKMNAIQQAYRDARIEAEGLLLSDSPELEGDVEDLRRGLQAKLAQIRGATE